MQKPSGSCTRGRSSRAALGVCGSPNLEEVEKWGERMPIAPFRGKHFSSPASSSSPAFTSEQVPDHRGSSQGRGKLVGGRSGGTEKGPLTRIWDVGLFLLDAAYVLNGVFLINGAKGIRFRHFPYLSSEMPLTLALSSTWP